MKFNLYPAIPNVAANDTFLVWDESTGRVRQAEKIQIAINVESVQALKDTDVSGLLDGTGASVAGYASVGDGGGGLFIYSSTSVDADNGGTIFQPTAGAGRWLRVYSGPMNVMWFGAKADGATDDAAAFNAAITALPAAGGTIYAPRGTYVIGATIVLNKRMTLCGDGATETYGVGAPTVLSKKSTLAATGITLTSASSNIFDLALVCQEGNGGDGISILANGCSLRNVTVSNAGQDGIRIGSDSGTNANSWSLINVNSSGNTRHGVYVHDLNFNANAGCATRLACIGNGGDGVRNRHADKNTYVGCLMEDNGAYGWHFLCDAPHQSLNTVIGGDSEVNATADINVNNASWYNTFINPGALTTANYNIFTTVLSERVNRIASGLTAELLSNAPQGGAGAAGTQEYYSIYDSSAVERIRLGFNADTSPKADLIPVQVMGDTFGDVLVASRDINDGSIRFYVGLGPVARAGIYGPDGTLWIGPGPTNSNAGHVFFQVPNGGWNGAATGAYVGKDAGTSRSINAAGTLNASGTDYAEYMTKVNPDEIIPKGAICGVNSDNLLTTKFSDSVRFVIKSTNPSYVGGDTWGRSDKIGPPPERPRPIKTRELFKTEADADAYAATLGHSSYDAAKYAYASALAKFEQDAAAYYETMEVARKAVDRIAFAGQAPVIVSGAKVGDYLVPAQGPNDSIVCMPVAQNDATLAQYKSAVGVVTALLPDGKVNAFVKVV